GAGRFERPAGSATLFRISPEFDGATLALAAALVQDMKLGQGSAPDIISVGASATDYVGHTYGTEGLEMGLQLASLDRDLGDFFKVLDATGVDYVVALSADHGGHDIPERNQQNGAPMAVRIDPALNVRTINTTVAGKLGLSGQVLWGGNNG